MIKIIIETDILHKGVAELASNWEESASNHFARLG